MRGKRIEESEREGEGEAVRERIGGAREEEEEERRDRQDGGDRSDGRRGMEGEEGWR